jgi:hypothetical protein
LKSLGQNRELRQLRFEHVRTFEFLGDNDLKTKPSEYFYDLLTFDFPNKNPLDSSTFQIVHSQITL